MKISQAAAKMALASRPAVLRIRNSLGRGVNFTPGPLRNAIRRYWTQRGTSLDRAKVF